MRVLDEKRADQLSADLAFVSDSQEVEAVREYFSNGDGDECDAFFVGTADGDYTEVWGIQGIIPYNHKRAVRLF
jgi:hypothetical protein